MTTLYAIDYLDEALWNPGMSCAILAHEQKYNAKIFSTVKRAFENLLPEIKPITKTNTKYAYDFVSMFDGTLLDSSIYVDTDVRSGTVQRLHITEAAWLKDSAKIDAGAKQAVPKGGSITEETTANGFNDFFDKYTQAEEIENKGQMTAQDYKTYFYAWWENPEYALPGTMPAISADDRVLYGDEAEERRLYGLTDGQLLWRRWKINELRQSNRASGVTLNGLQLFRQEYPASRNEAFQSGAGNVFDVNGKVGTNPLTLEQCIEQLNGNQEMIDKLKLLYPLGVKFWQMPSTGKKYVMGVDPSDGEGADFGCGDVWDEESLTQVAQYYGKVRPDVLAEVISQIGYFYNEAFIGVENNMLSCILSLVKIYSNYFFTATIDEKTMKKTKKIGWSTNTKTRNPMIDDFIAAYEENTLTINSTLTLTEMKTFVTKDNGKREHANGKHDDALIAGMICIQMKKLKPKQARAFADKPF